MDRKQVQRFLGFAHFFTHFSETCCVVAAPLHALTSKAKLVWTPWTEQAFERLKKSFSTAPDLVLPDTKKQFVVEVDASEVGIGAVLSQQDCRDDKLHPCPFLSRKLSSVERNYGVGNR